MNYEFKISITKTIHINMIHKSDNSLRIYFPEYALLLLIKSFGLVLNDERGRKISLVVKRVSGPTPSLVLDRANNIVDGVDEHYHRSTF